MITDKDRENRARRIAGQRGYRLEKSRRHDPRATDYGRYQLIDATTNTVASLGGPWLTLHEVEQQLEILSAVDELNAVRLIQAVARLAMDCRRWPTWIRAGWPGWPALSPRRRTCWAKPPPRI